MKRVVLGLVGLLGLGVMIFIAASNESSGRLLAVTQEQTEVWEAFNEFQETQGRKYASFDELQYRFNIFKENYYAIKVHNRQGYSYQLAINQFSDMTIEEFKATYANLRVDETTPRNFKNFQLFGLPDSVDWQDKGGVTEVKDQGQCGSCWTFGTTGTFESRYFQDQGTLLSFSEQQILDCAYIEYGNFGCNGGMPSRALNYLMKWKLSKEQDWPYLAKRTAFNPDCWTVPNGVAQVTNQSDVKPNELALKAAVVTNALAVAITAGNSDFMSYSSGVLDACGSNTANIDHAVLLVGYGTDSILKKDYWRIKNSWGTSWGEKGYIRIRRDDSSSSSGLCKVASVAVTPNGVVV